MSLIHTNNLQSLDESFSSACSVDCTRRNHADGSMPLLALGIQELGGDVAAEVEWMVLLLMN